MTDIKREKEKEKEEEREKERERDREYKFSHFFAEKNCTTRYGVLW